MSLQTVATPAAVVARPYALPIGELESDTREGLTLQREGTDAQPLTPVWRHAPRNLLRGLVNGVASPNVLPTI